MRFAQTLILSAVAMAGLAGCGPSGHDYQPPRINYDISSPREVRMIRRVAFIELDSQNHNPDLAGSMTDTLFRQMQEWGLFHIRLIRRTDPACEDMPFWTERPLTMPEMAAIRERLGVDAVLFGSVKNFRPHPNMQLGLFLRLIDLRKGKLVWGVDHVWDSSQRDTCRRIRQYFDGELRDGYEPADWELALMSPRRFQGFVAYEVTGTLPIPQGKDPRMLRPKRSPFRELWKKAEENAENL